MPDPFEPDVEIDLPPPEVDFVLDLLLPGPDFDIDFAPPEPDLDTDFDPPEPDFDTDLEPLGFDLPLGLLVPLDPLEETDLSSSESQNSTTPPQAILKL